MKTEPTEAKKMIENSWLLSSTTINFKNDAIKAIDIAFKEGQSSPKIKQLEWKEVNYYIEARTIIGKYLTLSSGEKLEHESIVQMYFCGTGEIVFDGTLNEAKAAAQADFEKRVMGCLDLKAQQKQALIDMMRGDEELGLYDE